MSAGAGPGGLLRQALSGGRGRIGSGLVVLVALVALLGPLLAPHGPTEFVGVPYGEPSARAWFGTDGLGRDALSRFLWGGRSILVLSLAATVLGVAAGVAVGLLAAFGRAGTDEVLMRLMDVTLAFPQIVLVLLLVATLGPQLWLIVVTVALGHMPRVARVARGAAQEVVERDFVKAAVALGERTGRILLHEVMPNIAGPLCVEFGLRLTYSIGVIAAVGFMGLGQQPPAADWGLMINENRIGLTLQPWPVLLPVAAIALLTVGMNLLTDAVARVSAGIDR